MFVLVAGPLKKDRYFFCGFPICILTQSLSPIFVYLEALYSLVTDHASPRTGVRDIPTATTDHPIFVMRAGNTITLGIWTRIEKCRAPSTISGTLHRGPIQGSQISGNWRLLPELKSVQTLSEFQVVPSRHHNI